MAASAINNDHCSLFILNSQFSIFTSHFSLPLLYPIARHIVFPLIRLGLKTVEGLERLPVNRPFIIAANHLGMFDPVFLGVPVVLKTKRKLRWLVDPNRKYWRWIGQFTSHWTNAVPIERGNYSGFFQRLTRFLEQGDCLGIFPEGEIARTARLQTPKLGMVRIGRDSQTPIVPVGLRHTELPLWRAILNRFRSPEGVTIRVGEPITIPNSTPSADFPAWGDRIMNEISRLSGFPYP